MRRIGKYKVIRELGSGGMAQVYVAHDNVGREVAIKLMKESADMDDELRRRFRREAEATAALSHRNIVTLYEFDEVDGVPYIVMENLGGTDLADLLRGHGGKSLAVDQCVDIALQAAAGLGYAHGRGVVHRDIKPSNVRVLDDGLVKIMDFGIAHVASSTITKTGVSIGTPQYMSPEQIHGNKVDHRTDIWSLGAVLYEMVSNHSPFVTDEDRKGFTIERILRLQRRIVQDPTPSFESLGVEVPADLGRIIFRCLEKDPRDRYQSTAELIRALEHYQKQAVGAISSLEEEVARDIGKYLGLARALLANKNYQQAEAAARRVLVLDEGNSEANQVLADLEIAKRKDALEQRALALAEKARSVASQGDCAQANKLIERAVDGRSPLAPDSRKLENVRAELSAERARQKIASLSQHLRQARNAIQENQLDGARRELEAAVAIDPEALTLPFQVRADESLELKMTYRNSDCERSRSIVSMIRRLARARSSVSEIPAEGKRIPIWIARSRGGESEVRDRDNACFRRRYDNAPRNRRLVGVPQQEERGCSASTRDTEN